MRTSTYLNISSLSFLHSFLLVFFKKFTWERSQLMENTQVRTSTYLNISLSSFLHSFFLVFKKISWSVPFLLVFLNFLHPSHQKIFPWEHRNIGGSPPLHNSLGIFCWGRSLKIQKEIKRDVYTEFAHQCTIHWEICYDSLVIHRFGMYPYWGWSEPAATNAPVEDEAEAI